MTNETREETIKTISEQTKNINQLLAQVDIGPMNQAIMYHFRTIYLILLLIVTNTKETK